MFKSIVPYEEKAEIVRGYLEGRMGYTESLGRANNSEASFRYWVYQYQEKGNEGFLPSRKNHRYPEEIKRKAVEDYLSGKGSLEQIGGKYGLRSITQLRQWIKVYDAHGDFNSRKNSGGGSYMKQGRDTTQEERIQIVKDCLAGGKKDQAPRTELEKAQIEIKQLKHKLYLAEMERDLLKKLDEIERRDAFLK